MKCECLPETEFVNESNDMNTNTQNDANKEHNIYFVNVFTRKSSKKQNGN